MSAGKILVVDDEEAIVETLRDILENEQYEVDDARDGNEALEKIREKKFDAILCDIKMPKVDGMEVLEKSMEINPELPVIMISGHGNIETAVDATKKGAYDFIEKPPDLNRLLITIRNAIDRTDLIKETKTLKKKVSKTQDIIGDSESVQDIKKTIDKVAGTDARVLITGDNGTGKELVAQWIHSKSNRAEGPFVEVNCAAIPSELIESELFGHEKGSFTSAVKRRIGKFEQASGGTLFLDEIGDMSHSAQAKVLRSLQENKIYRVGGDKPIEVDVRIVAATNKDLQKEIAANRFREDLYHRLSVLLINVPPLKDRKEDIPLLANSFLQEICVEYGMPEKEFDKKALEKLKALPWSGNIRELRNVVERLVIMSDNKIKPEDIDRYVIPGDNGGAPSLWQAMADGVPYDEFMKTAEKQFISFQLKKFDNDTEKTADKLGLEKKELESKIQKLGI